MGTPTSAIRALYLVLIGVVGFEAYKFMLVTNECSNAVIQSASQGARGLSDVPNTACVKANAHAKVVNAVLNSVAR